MATDNESFNRDLYNLLKVRGYNPVPLNSQNQRVKASQEADVIQFEFTKDGESYGTAWVTVDDAQNIIVYYDQEQQDSPSTSTPGVEYDDSWTGFLKHLKNWSQRRQMSFELANKDRLGDDMRQREYYKMKEKLGESYHPMGKKASYNDAVPNVKIVLQHNRALEEGEARFRNVARIYLENVEGERFLAPTTRPGIARVYARHIAEGGLPNDEKWNHIKSICEDYNKMAGFVRATRNGQFNESAQELVNEGINHYNNLRETLHKLTTHKGYHNYFESYTPALMEGDGEDISEMFMSQSLDPRIESAMPILSRLKKPVTEMSEVDTLAEWADSIISEKLELDENQFTVSAPPKYPPTEIEANSRDEAVELAAKRWRIPAEDITVHGGTKNTNQPNTSSQPEPSDGSPLARAEKKAKGMTNPLSKFSTDDLWNIGKLAIGVAEGDVVPFKKKDDEEDWDDESWIPSIEDFEQEERIRNRKPKHANDLEEMDSTTKTLAVPADKMLEAPGAETLAHNQSTEKSNLKALGLAEMEKDLYQGQRHDPRKGPQGPDKTAKMMAAKKAMKDARKALDKAFKGDVEENFIGMAPQAVAEDEMDEGILHKGAAWLAKKLASFAGYKSLKPGNYIVPPLERKGGKPISFIVSKERDLPILNLSGIEQSEFNLQRLYDHIKAHVQSGNYEVAPSSMQRDYSQKMMPKEEVEEDLDANQKRVGQLGPTEKVKNNNIGKLVGANESTEIDPELARIIEMARFKR